MNNRDRPGKSKGAPLAIIRCRERTSAAGHGSAWRLGWLPVFDAGVNLAVAVSDGARALLKWQSHFDNLKTIVRHALTWERKLLTRAS